MEIQALQQQFDESWYNDARVLTLSCNYFGDEVIIEYEGLEGKSSYHFTECHKVVYEHDFSGVKDRSVKEMTVPQIPYFMQYIDVEEGYHNDISFYIIKIGMVHLQIEVWCNKVAILENI